MKKSANEEQTQNKLGIANISQFAKDTLIEICSSKIDPEIAKKAIEKFPEYAKSFEMFVEGSRKNMAEVTRSNDESMAKVHSGYDKTLEYLREQASNDQLTFDEKMKLIEKMNTINDKKHEADRENKIFLSEMSNGNFTTVVILLIPIIAVLGGSFKLIPINNLKHISA